MPTNTEHGNTPFYVILVWDCGCSHEGLHAYDIHQKSVRKRFVVILFVNAPLLCKQFCETQWPRPPLFSPSWLILWNSMTPTSFVFTELANTIRYGGGFLYNLVFTEWRHCVSQNEVWGRGCYITLFSPSDVTAFHRIQWSMGEDSYITFFSPSDVTVFHRMKYGGGVLYNLVFTEWRHCVSHNSWGSLGNIWGEGLKRDVFSPFSRKYPVLWGAFVVES